MEIGVGMVLVFLHPAFFGVIIVLEGHPCSFKEPMGYKRARQGAQFTKGRAILTVGLGGLERRGKLTDGFLLSFFPY